MLQPLERVKDLCKDNHWDIPRYSIPNCNRTKCPIEDVILNYARENLVMFNIFIKDPYAKRFQKDEKITKTSYIANSGGLLGLCMGFSLISAAEILFHCVFGIFSVIIPSAKRKSRAMQMRHRNPTFGNDNEDDDSGDSGEDEVLAPNGPYRRRTHSFKEGAGYSGNVVCHQQVINNGESKICLGPERII